jgi:hypothetical protein
MNATLDGVDNRVGLGVEIRLKWACQLERQ